MYKSMKDSVVIYAFDSIDNARRVVDTWVLYSDERSVGNATVVAAKFRRDYGDVTIVAVDNRPLFRKSYLEATRTGDVTKCVDFYDMILSYPHILL